MLRELTIEFIYHFMLIFARLGTAFSLLPVLSEKYIFMRGRLGIALATDFILYPIIAPYLPAYSENFSLNVKFLVIEMLIGVVISLSAKFIFASLHVVGQIIAMQSGLGSASFFDPSQHAQTAIFSSFLTLAAVVTVLVTDTHYLFFEAIIASYERFPPGQWLDIGDIAKFVTYAVSDSFLLAFKLSSPILVVSMVMLVGSGVLARLMPNLQVFFVLTPAQMLVIFIILYIVLTSLINKLIDSLIVSLNIAGF